MKLILAACWCVLLAGVSLWAQAAITIDHAIVTAADGTRVPYDIGTLWVPENRTVRGSRLIGVGFARIRARTPTGAPPVFWLPGGPGVTVLDAFDGKSDAAHARLASWLTYGATADLVIVEQRGYTLRGERLETTRPALPLDQPRTAGADAHDAIALARRAI